MKKLKTINNLLKITFDINFLNTRANGSGTAMACTKEGVFIHKRLFQKQDSEILLFIRLLFFNYQVNLKQTFPILIHIIKIVKQKFLLALKKDRKKGAGINTNTLGRNNGENGALGWFGYWTDQLALLLTIFLFLLFLLHSKIERVQKYSTFFASNITYDTLNRYRQ